jgi:OmpR-family two-component system manganese-sensing response regulator
VDIAHDGQAAYAQAGLAPYNLLILDWMLPTMSGLDLCQRLRSEGWQPPVLFLTAKDTVNDRVQGLDAGADDYLIKPFEFQEFLARVRALLRRPLLVETTASGLQVGDLTLDVETRLVDWQGRVIPLSEKEAQLLAYFLRHPGQVLTHDQIFQHLWPEDAKPASNVLAAQIRLLRRKLEGGEGSTPLIQTVYGKGYRLSLDGSIH